MSSLPRQKVLEKEKVKDDFQWAKNSANYYIDNAIYSSSRDKEEILLLLQAANGEVSQKAYSHVLNPYNARANEKIKQYPAKMRNYDIITPLVDMWLGEKAEEPEFKNIYAKNSDVSIKLEEQFSESMNNKLTQDFISELNKQGIETGIDSKEVQDYTKNKDIFYATAKDKRAILGQQAIDLMQSELDIKDVNQEAFRNWMVADRCITFKDISSDNIEFENVDLLEAYPFLSNRSNYIEDGNAFVRKMRWSDSDILDRFHDELMELKTNDFDPISHIEDLARLSVKTYDSQFLTPTTISMNDSSDSNWFYDDNYIDVYHVVWKTYRKIGILSYRNITGEEVEKEVSDDYKLDKENGDEEIEWKWVNQVYETWRIDDNLYPIIRPHLVQRNDLNNSSECKLPYNGLIKRNTSNKIYSAVARALPYQILNNIIHFQLEKMINKNKDKMMVLPMGLIPDEPGWDENLMMYMADATGIIWVDETKPNATAAMQAIKSVDMSLNNYIKDMYNITREVKNEMWDLLGVNRQRFGDIKTSDGKGNTENAIIRSSVITREQFRKFHRLQNKDVEGLIDFSKIAWRKGKKTAYNTSDEMNAFFDLNEENLYDYQNTNFGVYNIDTTEELKKINDLKALTFSFAQNGSKPGEIAEILDSNSFNFLKTKLEKIDKLNAELQQKQEEDIRTSNEKIAEIELEKVKQVNSIKVEVANINADKDIEVALINADIKSAELNANGEKVSIDTSFEDRSLKRQEQLNKNNTELKKINNEDKTRKEELRIKEKDVDNKLKIAKENKNRFDKK